MGEASLAKLDAKELTYRRAGVQLLGLTYVFVHPLRRRLGWGRQVLEQAVKWVDEREIDLYTYTSPYGIKKLRDGSEVSCPDAAALRKLYKEYGFVSSRRGWQVMVRRWSGT